MSGLEVIVASTERRVEGRAPRRALRRSLQHSPRRALRVALLTLAALSAGGACTERAARVSVAVDDLGDTVRITGVPTRVVSLNPVTTELIFALGAGDRLVGRTSWDLFPDEARAVTDLGPGMQPNVEAVLGQRPDLVVLYGSESNRLAAQQLRTAGVATLTYRTDRVEDLERVIPIIAAALGVEAQGVLVRDSVLASLQRVRTLPRPATRVRAYWHIWDAPLMTIGGGSYLTELLEIAGAENVFGDLAQPSPQVSMEEIARRDPDVILAGPVGAARIRREPAWRTVRAVREGRVITLDTTVVGRPGVRMGEAAAFLRRALVDSLPR